MIALREENYFLATLLKKNNIQPYFEFQNGQFDPLQEAYKVIDNLNAKITDLQQQISLQGKWLNDFNIKLISKSDKVDGLVEQFSKITADADKYVMGKLQDNKNMNIAELREYAKSHRKQIKRESETPFVLLSENIQKQNLNA